VVPIEAQVIIVTKCHLDISKEEKRKIKASLAIKSHQKLFFTGIHYENYFTNGVQQIPLQLMENFNLVTGIAKPQPLVKHLRDNRLDFKHFAYPDHHLSTEKDFMRLKEHLPHEKLFYLPIKTVFLEDQEVFDKEVMSFVAQA